MRNILQRLFGGKEQELSLPKSRREHLSQTTTVSEDGILGAIIGDVVGSFYEFCNVKHTDFQMFVRGSNFTDDTVMTIAIADWLLSGVSPVKTMRDWGQAYPNRGYGGMFYRWLFDKNELPPYNSFGNGAGMRVSPCGYFAKSLDEALNLAKQSAEVTHNHPEGIKGAQAIAAAIFLARQNASKEEIKSYIEQNFGYNLSRTCADIRPTYEFNETCQGSCPEAIIAFLESTDYESAIRLAISLGGDSDTIACMTGGIAAAYYGIPDWMIEQTVKCLPDDMIDIINRFDKRTL
ncbi:MAG: ADP-ribosylglycohydrolase family protein [Alistipes sp.]|nr:ADP-ribosylglycohydrolase family protein [Alistipes sp.]